MIGKQLFLYVVLFLLIFLITVKKKNNRLEHSYPFGFCFQFDEIKALTIERTTLKTCHYVKFVSVSSEKT